MNREDDIIDWTEKQAAQAGQFAGVDEHYVKRFCTLSMPEVEQMTRVLLFDQVQQVLSLASGSHTEDEVERVSQYIFRMFHFIGLGLMQSDEFGRVRFVSRLGLKPELECPEEIESKVNSMKRRITGVVRRMLPLLQSDAANEGSAPF